MKYSEKVAMKNRVKGFDDHENHIYAYEFTDGNRLAKWFAELRRPW
jgi:hypothetical protein